MAILSMTGFGRGEFSSKEHKITVELSSVNRKQFDCSVSMPRELASCEAKLQRAISSQITRGYVKGAVAIERCGDQDKLGIDLDAVEQQLKALRSAAKHLGLRDDLTLSSFLGWPGLAKASGTITDPAEIWPDVERAVLLAVEGLLAMRSQEGSALEQDIRGRLKRLQEINAQIEVIAPQIPGVYQKNLEQRLKKLLEAESLIDQDALAREVALFADRCDISEELTRLNSHFSQSETTLDKGGVCGRTLDFICQEMFREINTVGSKASHASVSTLVIEFKATLEAIREQVQNIE